MLKSDELVKAYLNEYYPDFKYLSFDEYNDSSMKNSFTIKYIIPNIGQRAMEISIIEFITFVFNKLNTKKVIKKFVVKCPTVPRKGVLAICRKCPLSLVDELYNAPECCFNDKYRGKTITITITEHRK